MSTTATTAKHRDGARLRQDQAGSRHPGRWPRAGPHTPPVLHPPAKGTWVPGSCPLAPPASIPPLLQEPTAWPGAAAWGTSGDNGSMGAWTPCPPCHSWWLSRAGGYPLDVGTQVARGWVLEPGVPGAGVAGQGVSGRGGCGPCPALQAEQRAAPWHAAAIPGAAAGLPEKAPAGYFRVGSDSSLAGCRGAAQHLP